jgi:hypothetical protein
MDISVKKLDEFELNLDEKSTTTGDLVIHLTTEQEDHVSVVLPLAETNLLVTALAIVAQRQMHLLKAKLN